MGCCNRSLAEVVDMAGIGASRNPLGRGLPGLGRGVGMQPGMMAPASPPPAAAPAGHADHGGACCASCAAGKACEGAACSAAPAAGACEGGSCPLPARATAPAAAAFSPVYVAPAGQVADPTLPWKYATVGALAIAAGVVAYYQLYGKGRRRR